MVWITKSGKNGVFYVERSRVDLPMAVSHAMATHGKEL